MIYKMHRINILLVYTNLARDKVNWSYYFTFFLTAITFTNINGHYLQEDTYTMKSLSSYNVLLVTSYTGCSRGKQLFHFLG